MTRLLPLTALLCLLCTVTPAAPPGKFTAVDLKPHINQKLTASFSSGLENNTLKELGKGGRTLHGVNLQIGDGVVQLGSKSLDTQKPYKVKAIKVGGKVCAKIHILHATEFGNGNGSGEEGDPGLIKDGTKIAEYQIRYEDGKTESIPVVYGEDVRDGGTAPTPRGVTRGKIAWQGDNDAAKELNRRHPLVPVYLGKPAPRRRRSPASTT